MNWMKMLYSLLMVLATPVLLIRLFIRSIKEPRYRKRWGERLGLSHVLCQDCIWVHAVSVGEFIAAIPLVNALLERYPSTPIYITTTTLTSSDRVRATFADRVFHQYMPFDLPILMKRFVKKSKPKLFIIMETEIWPNLMASCKVLGIPVVLANGRISKKSFMGYQRFIRLFTPVLHCYSSLAVQSTVDLDRYLNLGAPKSRMSIVGNIKFDLTVSDELREQGTALKKAIGERLVWIAGSTHKGEDEQILQVHRELLKQYPDMLLIIVPRHPERFDKVYLLVEQASFSVERRSKVKVPSSKTQVYLADTMGEMMIFYQSSDIAFVGGSLEPIGGHNILEPAALGKPVLTGPHMDNFKEITQHLVAANACFVVPNAQQLIVRLEHLLAQADLRQQMGEAGLAVVEQNKGALGKILNIIEEVLTPKKTTTVNVKQSKVGSLQEARKQAGIALSAKLKAVKVRKPVTKADPTKESSVQPRGYRRKPYVPPSVRTGAIGHVLDLFSWVSRTIKQALEGGREKPQSLHEFVEIRRKKHDKETANKLEEKVKKIEKVEPISKISQAKRLIKEAQLHSSRLSDRVKKLTEQKLSAVKAKRSQSNDADQPSLPSDSKPTSPGQPVKAKDQADESRGTTTGEEPFEEKPVKKK